MEVMGSNETSDNTPTPFIVKLYELVNDEKSKDLICWSHEQNRPGFVVLEPVQLASQILPKFFKHSNFSSFVRQLNIYGFHKVDHPLGQCFHHPNFKEGSPQLLPKIHRQQPKRAEAENAEMYRSLLQRLEELQKKVIDEMEERMQGMTECLYFINADESRYNQQKEVIKFHHHGNKM
ncbi:Heat stress transcription factor C-1 [Entamoeba marina]